MPNAKPKANVRRAHTKSQGTPVQSPTGKAAKTREPDQSRRLGKLGMIHNLLARTDGATLDELVTATGWQTHSVRAGMTALRRQGLAVRFVLETGQHATAGAINQKLVAAIGKAKAWWKRLQAETDMTVADLAKAEGLSRNYVNRVLRLAFISPAVVNAILDGIAPTDINLERLKDVKHIAPSWTRQHRMLGLTAAQR